MSVREGIPAILGKARAFWEARILMTAAELDVFSLLKDAPKTAQRVCEELSSDPRGTEALLNALVALGLLLKKDGAFRTRPGLERALSRGAPETVLPMIRHMAQLWTRWGRLTEIVLGGEQARWADALERDVEGLKSFIGAMHTIGREMAEGVIARLDLSQRERMIDVGGGSGVYTIAALRAAPGMRATLFDRSLVTEIAREKLAEAGLLDRVTLASGDLESDALPGGHDLALLSAIIHQNDRRQNLALYRKVWGALLPGGEVVIRDHVMSDDHTEPASGALFAINMLVNTEGGGTYSFGEIAADLEAAGFADPKLLHRGEMDSLVAARRPV